MIRYLEVYHILSEGLAKDIIFGYSLFRVIGVYIYAFESKIAEAIVSQKLDGNELLSFFGFKKIEELETAKYQNIIPEILQMLGRECWTNFEQFINEDEIAMRDFAEMKRGYFQNGHGGPDRIFSIVESAINELRMFKA